MYICLISISIFYRKKFYKIVEGKKIVYGHGTPSLCNGIDNANICIIFIMVLTIISNLIQKFENNDFNIILNLVCILAFTCTISNELYRFSEIKHISDGICSGAESDKFYIVYSDMGILHLIAHIIALIYFRFQWWEYAVNIIFIILIFILGMGEMLQTSGINEYGNKNYKVEQNIKFFKEIPINIIKLPFDEKRKIKFKTNFNNNMHFIISALRKRKQA